MSFIFSFMINLFAGQKTQGQFWRKVVLIAIPMLFAVACGQKGGLRPFEPTVVANQIIAGQPQLVTFSELEVDPSVYQDKLIRVTGSYVRLPVVACSPYSGPNPSWAMVAEDLRLDTLGFEGLLFRLAQEQTSLTIDGILRRYDGPLGCGKRPEAGILWYLEALQIVQPNPLVLVESDGTGNSGIIPPPFPTDTPPGPVIEETPDLEGTTGPGTPTRTPSPTSDGLPTATATLEPAGSPTGGAVTQTATPTSSSTPTLAVTTTSGTPTTTPTPSQTPTLGATTAPLPSPTSGGGYPGVTETPAYP